MIDSWVKTIALGLPVEPEVNKISAILLLFIDFINFDGLSKIFSKKFYYHQLL